MKKILLITIVVLISIFTFGQETKNIVTDFNSANSKVSGMRINSNVDRVEGENTTKSALKQLTQAGTANHAVETYEKEAVFADRNPKDEVLERRDRTSKHFRNADGSFDAILSTGSVNYFEKGQWLTIERAILPNNTREYPEYEFANTKNSFKTYFSSNQSKGIKTVIEGQEISEWQNKKIEFLDENLNLISAINAENGKLNTNDAKAIYSNIFPYTEAHITQLFDGRKIDYEISSPEFLNHIPANSKYVAVSEEIVLPKGWNAKYYIDKLNENPTETKKQISIFNEKGEEIMRYMPPAYFEKNNEHDIENLVGDYEIEQVGQILTIKTLVEADWLKTEGRVFPIIIDPTVNVQPNNAMNWTRSVASDGWNYSNVYFGHADGCFVRSSMKFNTSSITAGSIVSQVKAGIHVIGAFVAWGGQIKFGPSADPTTTSGINLYNSILSDFSDTYAMSNTSDGKHIVDFTSTGASHVQSKLGNIVSLGIRPVYNYWTSGQYYQITGHTGGNNRPYLAVTYAAAGVAPSCTTPISPAHNSTSHMPGDPLTWNAASGATSYDVYFGTSSDPSLVTNVATTSYSPALADNTTYYWKIVPKNANGTPTGCSVWEFTTGTGPESGDYRTRYMDGISRYWNVTTDWEVYNGSNWVTASTPPNSSTVNVFIRDNSLMIINAYYQINNLKIEGLLQFDWKGAIELTVNGDVTLLGNADFQTSSTEDQYNSQTFRNLFHRLIVKGNIFNNANNDHGMLFNDKGTYGWNNFSSLVEVRFAGSGNSEWSGTGENDLGGLTVGKDNANDVVTIKPDKLVGWHSNNLDGNGFFMYDKIEPKGILKIGGLFPMITRFGIQSGGEAAHYPRQLPIISSPTSGNNFTLIIDNPNFGITGYTSVECYGNLQITQGTMNVGSGLGNYIEFYDGSSLIVDGGELLSTGSIAYLGNGSFSLSLSAGMIKAGFYGNSLSNTRGWFDIRNNATVNISGGEIHLINPSYTSSIVYPMYNMAASNVTITGGKLLIGSSSSPNGVNTFSMAGPTPSIELFSSASIKSNAIMWNNVQCHGYLDIPVDCAFSIYDQDHYDVPYIFSITGDINHEGDLYGEVTNSKILFNGTSTQTFNSTGAYSGSELLPAGISILEVNNPAGVLLTGNGTSVTKNLIKTNGTFNIGSCYLNLHGIVTRTTGYFGGTANSTLNIYGTGNLGNLFFDPTANNLKVLDLDRTTGIINLATDLNIENSINFEHGVLYTYLNSVVANGSQTIYLAPDAQLVNENNNSHIYGTVSISNAANASFGNIGATMTSMAGLGNTSITRITGTEGVKLIGVDNIASIACHWDIGVQTQPSSAINTTFKWLSPFDNGISTTGMQVYTLPETDIWESVGAPTDVTGDPRSIVADASHFSIWTVGVKNIPLPVELLYFNAICNCNDKEFTWETASEINSDYFEIMASANAKDYMPVAKIPAAGNSTQNIKYTHTLQGQNDKTYYRLKQTDFDGQFELFNPISIQCNSSLPIQVIIYPNPAQDELYCSIVTDEKMDVEIQIVNYLGQLCYVKNHSIEKGANTIDISSKYNSGLYLVKVISNSRVIETKKIIIK
ncbi:MAG: T9SS type A sorting domain-containing protein [Bacteroidales bacterium]|nr:T9SS type A sorting domain-containing protein [Bacteroidales bacterium]